MHTRTATFSQKHVENLSTSQATLGNWMISVGQYQVPLTTRASKQEAKEASESGSKN